MKDNRKDHAIKLFNKFKHPLQPKKFCFFTYEKNFCQDEMVNLQNNHLLTLSLTRYTDIDENPTPSSHYGDGDGDVIPLFIFPYELRLVLRR